MIHDAPFDEDELEELAALQEELEPGDEPDEATEILLGRLLARPEIVERFLPPGLDPTFSVRWVSDIVDQPAPEPPELIEGFLRKGELSVVVAPRAVGKSWFTYNLATLLDRGEGKFLGRLEVRRHARTLIAQGELDPWGSESRWRFLTGDAMPERVAETFDSWAIRIEKMRTNDRDPETGLSWTSEAYVAKVTDRLESTIVAHDIDLLVIDPWAVFFDGEENSKREVQAALDVLRGISLRTGVAILIVHHISKVADAREPEDLWRGSSRLADWASTRVTLMPHFRKEADWKKKGLSRAEARRIVDIYFLRRGGSGDEFTIQWDVRTGWWDERVLKAEEATREAGEVRRYNPADVAAACAESGGYWPSKRAAAEVLKVSPSVVGKYLEAACLAGLLEECAGEAPQAKGYRVPAPSLLAELQAPAFGQAEAEALAADAVEEEF